MSHLVLWVSFCGVLVLFLVGFVLFCFWKTPGFLLSPILQYVGIANHRQNVLMTVRASSVHGMSSKKKASVQFEVHKALTAIFVVDTSNSARTTGKLARECSTKAAERALLKS